MRVKIDINVCNPVDFCQGKYNWSVNAYGHDLYGGTRDGHLATVEIEVSRAKQIKMLAHAMEGIDKAERQALEEYQDRTKELERHRQELLSLEHLEEE